MAYSFHFSYVEEWYRQCTRYAKAKSRCLFEGFEFSEDRLSVFIKQDLSEFHLPIDDILSEGYTIECLTMEGLTLTENALR